MDNMIEVSEADLVTFFGEQTAQRIIDDEDIPPPYYVWVTPNNEDE